MYSKLHFFIHFMIILALSVASLATVHAQTAEPAAAPAATSTTAAPAHSTVTGTLHGHIADPTGALIPGALVTIVTADGKTVGTATADSGGAYRISGLAAGSYIVQATTEGFAPFASPAIPLAAGQSKIVDVAMALQVEAQTVTVTDDSPQVSVEAGGNTDAVTLKGKELDSLSDDPDELSNELTALAGPSAGPDGAQIYIDGFSGGELPPKSAIREIRINQNPYSSEFDRLGYGRVEILMKPGADKRHGQFFIQGNDSTFNTGNPFTKNIPPYYSYQFNGTYSGALTKNSSFFVSAEQRNTENINAWSIPDAILPDSSGVYQDNLLYGVNLLNRRVRDNVSARFDWQLGARNTLTARYGFWSESEHGDLNQGSLSDSSTHESNTDHTVQISEAIMINDHAANESLFQFERHNENHFPDSTLPSINVQGDFSGGGFSGQKSLDHTVHLEFQNMTTMTHGAHAIKFGTRMRDTRDANFTNANFNGSFTFDSPSSYEAMANGLDDPHAPQTFAQLVAAGYGPASINFTSGQQSALANVFDMALFVQDDWKFNSRLTLSGGLRWESQNHIADHSDWAPRVAIAYALDGGKNKKTKTVLRGGYGFFYNRFGSGGLLTINRATLQQQIVLNQPTCTSTATSLNAIDMSTCTSTDGSSTALVPVKYEVDPHYHSPYSEQASLSLERQITAGTSLTLNYMHSFGVHQQVTRNANQATGGTPQDNSGGYLYEFYPEGVFKQTQIITSVNSTINRKISLMGSYTWSTGNGNSNRSASNAYDLDQDYGRTFFIARNMLFMMGNYTAPWGIRLSPFIVAQSGRPYNITLATDPLNNFFNQRPGVVASSLCAAPTTLPTTPGRYVQTSFGCLDSQPTAGETPIPINIGTGPAGVAINMRISRGFGIGPKLASANNQNPAGGPGGMPPGGPPPGGGGPPPGGGGGRGGPGGGGFGGGMGGPGMGGNSNTSGRKYTLTFSAQALNMFNDIVRSNPNSTIIPTLDPTTGITGPGSQFGVSNSLAFGMFSQGSAARRVFVQVIFAF